MVFNIRREVELSNEEIHEDSTFCKLKDGTTAVVPSLGFEILNRDYPDAVSYLQWDLSGVAVTSGKFQAFSKNSQSFIGFGKFEWKDCKDVLTVFVDVEDLNIFDTIEDASSIVLLEV